MALVEVVDQAGAGRPPVRRFAGERAGSGDVGREEGAQPAEVLGGPLGRDGRRRDVEVSADQLGDAPDRDTPLGDPVQDRARRGLFRRRSGERDPAAVVRESLAELKAVIAGG
ncbi:hypothetical protein [Embleya scabrispora]|uniref:hypothetical protein n=1 Tax=Embleya scabrispora TaxID=159449 RepID=UPI00037F1C6A|nr:hypothetical protein [Embleya scabrispora]MYS78745.1 hypothetical protein [Streptomyces sp. SID5474]